MKDLRGKKGAASRGEHLANKKGHKKRGARPGNWHGAKGPRIGRQDKETTPMPQPRPDAKLPQRPSRDKTGGRNFVSGQNSHDGTVFRRTEDQLPRGNITLFAKIVYHDVREKLYQRHVGIVDKGTNREVLALTDWLANRLEGLPTKRVEVTQHREPKFYLTMPDGSVIPVLPETVGGGATPTAASAEDQIILGDLAPVRV